MRIVSLAWLLGALAACSSSSSGGGAGGSGDGGASGGSSPESATSTADGAGGDGGAAWDPRGAPLLAWSYLQGAFDSVGQEPLVEGGYVPPSPRRLVGCAVDAPELGPHVVYLERAAMAEDAPPDRQLLVVFADPGSSGPGGHFAMAQVARLVTPEDWAGACIVGTTLPLLGEVVTDARWELDLVRGENGVVSVSASPLPAECVSASLDATTVEPSLLIGPDTIAWGDTLDGGEAGARRDPPVGPGAEVEGHYELVRRAP